MPLQRTLYASLLLGSALAVACGGDSNGNPMPPGSAGSAGAAVGGTPSGGVAGASGDQGRGGAGAAGSPLGGGPSSGAGGAAEPLLDRPLPEAYVCEATGAVKISEMPKGESAVLGPLVEGGNLLAFTRMIFDPSASELGLFASIIESDGSIGSPVSVSADSSARRPVMVSQGDRTTLLWIQSSSTGAGGDTIWSAQFDASASIVKLGASTGIPTGDAYVNGLHAAATADEARIFLTVAEPSTGRSKIMSAPLATDGSVASSAVTVVESPGPLVIFDVTDYLGGYALGYGYYQNARAVARYVSFDSSFSPRHAAIDIPVGPFSMWGGPMNLFPRGEQMLIASVGAENFDGEHRGSFVSLGVYGNDGRLIGTAERLQAPVRDVENTSPRVMGVGDDLALTWSKGSVIYACGGCVPDNVLQFVILDGETLRPKSNVVEFASPDAGGGLIDAELVGDAEAYLLLTNVQYHVTSAMAAGALTCERQ